MWARWHRIVLFAFLLVLISTAAHAETSYLFEVAENGEAEVTIEFTGRIPLIIPSDVVEPVVEGGALHVGENETTAETAETATVIYTSSYHTRKEQGVWHFEANIPFADEVTVVLPQAVHVVQSVPRANFVKLDTWQLAWENVSKSVAASYVRVAEPSSQVVIEVPPQYLPYVIIIALGLVGAYLLLPKKKQFGKPKMSEGQLNVIRAANANEALVLKIVLQHNGHIKRNELEHESKLSKSSLASVLKNLEHKNIVSIDRTFFVHYIALTKWFRELK